MSDASEQEPYKQIAPVLLAAPVYEMRRRANGHLCGFDMSQNLLSYPTWNYVLLRERPRVVIELGTCLGGFSCLLGKTCQAIECEFHTFDRDRHKVYADHYDSHGVRFHEVNVLSDEGITAVRDLLAIGKAVLLCDNGNKIKEFNTFAPFTKVGDIIGAHDYIANPEMQLYWTWSELKPRHVEPTCEKYHLRPYHPDWFDKTAWFVRKREQ